MNCKHYISNSIIGRCALRTPKADGSVSPLHVLQEIYDAWKQAIENAGGKVGGLGGKACGGGICCFEMTRELTSQSDCPSYEV